MAELWVVRPGGMVARATARAPEGLALPGRVLTDWGSPPRGCGCVLAHGARLATSLFFFFLCFSSFCAGMQVSVCRLGLPRMLAARRAPVGIAAAQ